jgi:hypothetical protein
MVAGIAISRFKVSGVIALVIVVPIALHTAYLVEDHGGVGVWPDLITPELREDIRWPNRQLRRSRSSDHRPCSPLGSGGGVGT